MIWDKRKDFGDKKKKGRAFSLEINGFILPGDG